MLPSTPSATSLIQDPISVTATLLAVLAGLFYANGQPWGKSIFRIVPLLVFAYFVPTLLSNTGILPKQSPAYDFIKSWMLPASLLLLTMSVDIHAMIKLGPKALAMFGAGTLGIVIGGPLALFIAGGVLPHEFGDQVWKGLAALSGSWIGGGANFVAIGESVGATESTISLMVVVDTVVAGIWMAVLFYFAGRDQEMDKKIGADRRSVELVRERVATFQAEVARPTSLAELLMILAIALTGTSLTRVIVYGDTSHGWGGLPSIGEFLGKFAWVVILVTAIGVALSFTRARRLEGAGSSAIGSTMLFMLIATIGAKADLSQISEVPGLMLIGLIWMSFHAATILLIRRWIKAPIFFAAVGSQANVGGAASAPVVAAAFHPALASVGVVLGVGGYVLGTYAGLLCAGLLSWVYRIGLF